MFEIIRTLLVSLSFAATGAGIAWSVTSDASEPLAPVVVETSANQAAKNDRLEISTNKSDRLPATAPSRGSDAVIIVYANDNPSTTIFRAPVVMASAH